MNDLSNQLLLTPRWRDQPEFECFEAITELLMHGSRMVQVAKVSYKGELGYMVTCGNLFGSQTILVPNADEALKALNVAQEQSRKVEEAGGKEVPPFGVARYGWKLLPNKEEKVNG